MSLPRRPGRLSFEFHPSLSIFDFVPLSPNACSASRSYTLCGFLQLPVISVLFFAKASKKRLFSATSVPRFVSHTANLLRPLSVSATDEEVFFFLNTVIQDTKKAAQCQCLNAKAEWQSRWRQLRPRDKKKNELRWA